MQHSSSDHGLVYIHGAGLGAWIWEDLTQVHNVPHLAVSFPDRDRNTAVRDKLGLKAYVNHVCQQIEGWPVRNFIIVSHSIGGVVGLEVASNFSDRVIGFIGICAAIPKPGGSFISCYPVHQRIIQQALMRFVGTKPPDPAIRRSLCAGLSEEQTSRVIDQFTPESRGLFVDSCNTDMPRVPTLYIRTTDDKEFGDSIQEVMIDNLEADKVVSIDSGHMPMLSNPRKLAKILSNFEDNIDT